MEVRKKKEYSSGGNFQIKQDYEYAGDDYWNWSVWLEAADAELDKVESVTYNLHYSFKEPVVIIKTRENKFRLWCSGWGTFTIYVRVNFKDTEILNLEHELQLSYPDGAEEKSK